MPVWVQRICYTAGWPALNDLANSLQKQTVLEGCRSIPREFHNRGLDHVLKFLLGLVPNHEPFAARVGGHVCLAKLDGFNFTGLPVLEGHIFLAHAIHTLKPRAQINAV